MTQGEFQWFLGGKLNVTYNCLDRHAESSPNKVALIWEKDQPGTHEEITFKYGNEWPRKYDTSSLRLLGSVGEPINHEAWKWFHDVVCRRQCTLVDTWWQTETGGVVICPSPADNHVDVKPTMAMRHFFGQQPMVIGEKDGQMADDRQQDRTIYGDHRRFIDTYFRPHPGYYYTGDEAFVDSDGHFGIIGRMDDVINVTGHRLGTAEIEDVLDEHYCVAESAVVPFPHPIKGEEIFAFIDLKETSTVCDRGETEMDIIAELKKSVSKSIAKFAVPDHILVTSAVGLLKTRSGKIMRRLLRKIAANQADDLGDVSTLANPNVVSDIIKSFQEKIDKND